MSDKMSINIGEVCKKTIASHQPRNGDGENMERKRDGYVLNGLPGENDEYAPTAYA